jgi:hypothetical protein
MISERRSGWMHRKAEEEGALVLGVDRRQRRGAPPGRREPDQPICAASKNLLSAGFRQYLGYEWSASHLRQFHPMLVPGLLQTEEYALSVLVHGNGYSAPEAALRWEARKERQKVHEAGPRTGVLRTGFVGLRRSCAGRRTAGYPVGCGYPVGRSYPVGRGLPSGGLFG